MINIRHNIDCYKYGKALLTAATGIGAGLASASMVGMEVRKRKEAKEAAEREAEEKARLAREEAEKKEAEAKKAEYRATQAMQKNNLGITPLMEVYFESARRYDRLADEYGHSDMNISEAGLDHWGIGAPPDFKRDELYDNLYRKEMDAINRNGWGSKYSQWNQIF